VQSVLKRELHQVDDQNAGHYLRLRSRLDESEHTGDNKLENTLQYCPVPRRNKKLAEQGA